MFNKRERIFLANISAWQFSEINILQVLYLLKDDKKIHGRGLQTLLTEYFNDSWTIGNDLLYRVLNSLEKERFLRSFWDKDEDINKRHIRKYEITDLGINRLNSLKVSFGHNIKDLEKTISTSMKYIWKDFYLQESVDNSKYLVSNTLFTGMNLLTLLSNKSYEGIYGRVIQEDLSSIYNNLWAASDGVLYPLLSDFETKGYLTSTWIINDEDNIKKRTARKFMITKKGQELLYEMTSKDSGIKNKLITVMNLCNSSYDLIYGNSSKNLKEIKNIINKRL